MRAPRDGGALLRPETRGWALAALLAAAAAVVLLLWLTPLTSLSRTGPMPWTAAALAMLAGLAILVRRSTPGLWTVCAATAVLNAGLLASAATVAGAVLTSAGFGYLVLYGAYAFERAWLTWLLALVATVSPVGLAASQPGLRPVTWVATTGGMLVAGALIGRVLRELRRLATVDSLTGVLTRTAFSALAPSALAGARRRGMPAVLALVDLDDFKSVNDTHGHAAGDDLLVRTTGAWQDRLRAQDLMGRAGGDEFVLLLPDTDADGARHLLGELADASTIDFSAGLAVAGPADTLDDLLRRADAGMYSVKRGKPAQESPAPPADRRD